MMSWGYIQMVNSGFMKQENRERGKSKPPNMRKCLFFKSIFFWLLDMSWPNLLEISNSILYHKWALTCLVVHLELIPSNYLNSFAAWNQGRKCCELGKSFQEQEEKSESRKFWTPLPPALRPISRNQTRDQSTAPAGDLRAQSFPVNCSGQYKDENSFRVTIT